MIRYRLIRETTAIGAAGSVASLACVPLAATTALKGKMRG